MGPLTLSDLLDALAVLDCEGAVRDEGLLHGAMNQPFQEVFGEVLYPPPFMRAAAFFFFVERAQALEDGNKRLGWVGARRILAEYGFGLSADMPTRIRFGLDVANRMPGLDTIEGIAAWYEANAAQFFLREF